MPLCLCLTRAPRPSELPLVLPRHLDSITRSLSSLPEPTSTPLPTHHAVTNSTVLWPIVLLSATPSTYHAVRPLIRMFLFFVMAFVAGVHFLTTAKSKPSVALGVMAAAASFREFGASLETESLFLAAWSRGRWEAARGGDT